MTQTALSDLRVRTEYEAWFLEAVYEMVDQRLAVKDMDELIYPPAGGPPTQTMYAVGNINIGDWRPGFLAAGAPLVFVTAFKLLDMLLEWVLAENRHASTYRFEQKIAALKGPVRFPPLVETRPWLRGRLVALYDELEPLRGTIIHARHFKMEGGALQVSSSKGGVIGPAVPIAPTDLRNLALVLVSLLRYLEGEWTVDPFGEKRIRRALDELSHLHGLSSLGQLPPGFLIVRVYVRDEDPIQCDMARVRHDVTARRQGQDVVFDLRIIAISRDGACGGAYLVPWDQLQDSGLQLRKMRAELAPYAIAPPADMDSAAIARDMKLLP
jgi:hypothetical protein